MNAQTAIDYRSLLSDLVDTVQGFTDSSDLYFNSTGETHVLNPFQGDIQSIVSGAGEVIPAQFFDELGIRSVTLNRMHTSFTLPTGFSLAQGRDSRQFKWHVFRNAAFIENLKAVLQDCPVISFSDWASVDGASQLWDGFLYDVIKPLNHPDINFLFYLGDLTRKLSHEVDEIVDIISDFSAHGNVTFLLHEREAAELWRVLNGEASASFSDATYSRKRYQSLFNTMKVDRLLVYSVDQAILYSSTSQFEMRTKASVNHRISQQDKDHFNAGYSLGLLLKLDIAHCIAFGLTAYGVFLENGVSPNRETLLTYLKGWIGSLQ